MDDLRKGMYVCELDRPWLDSPFLTQGFPLRTDRELQTLRELCTYVYVNPERSTVSFRGHRTAPPAPVPEPVLRLKPGNLHPPPTDPKTFSEQVVRASRVRHEAHDYILQTLEDVRLGHSINTREARRMVSALANQVVETPSAMIWMTHLKQRDLYTSTHSVNVCILSLTFGRFLGLDKVKLNHVGLGALLHDIGKLRVPLEILNKPSALTHEEFEIMKSHPASGYALVSHDGEIPWPSLDIVLHHHERRDGGGYPDRLTGEQIPFLTRLVSIVDIYDAISSDRAYHDGLSPQETLSRLYDMGGHGLDQKLVETFIRCIGIYPIGTLVELTNGQVALVVGLNENQKLRPVVMLLREADHVTPTERRLINLASEVWHDIPDAPMVRHVLPPGSLNLDLSALIRDYLDQQPDTARSAEARP